VITPPVHGSARHAVASARPHRPWRRYLLSLALVSSITLLAQPLASVLSPTNLAMLYVAAEVIAARYLGRGPSVLAAVLGVLMFDFFYVPPQITFACLTASTF